MSGIVGLFSDSESSEIIFSKMAERLSHRGPLEKFRYALTPGAVHIGLLADSSCFSEDHNHFKFLAIDRPSGDDNIPAQVVKCMLDMNCSNVLSEIPQMLTAIGVTEREVLVFRSLDGVRPLYFTKMVNGLAFSSERKAIWAIDSQETETLDPGYVLSIADNGKLKLNQVHTRSRPQVASEYNKDDHLIDLSRLLTESFLRIERLGKCGVLFSGGVDSSLVALMTNRVNPDTLLISAATPESKDFEKTIDRAAELSLDHRLVPLDADTVWENLPEIIYAIESCVRMDVEIAIPFFFAAKVAKEERCNVLLSGQGPDELFAGYARYETAFKEKGAGVVADELWSDYSITHETNIARDVGAIEYHGIGSFFPFLDLAFSQIALSTPVDLLLDPKSSPSRKILFRELVKRIGLPSEIADTQKHATQYSSGSSIVLQKAVVKYVPDARGLSKRNTTLLVRDVLNTIACEIGIPTGQKSKTKLELDMGPTERLIEKVGRLATSYLG